MFSKLRGHVEDLESESLSLMVGGVGYAVQITARLSLQLTSEQALTLFIFTKVNENEITLFGFNSLAEKRCFEKLLTVQGVGGRLALRILSTLTMPELARAIRDKDVKALCKVSGVGNKLAQRLVVELETVLAFFSSQISEQGQAATLLFGEPAERAQRLEAAHMSEEFQLNSHALEKDLISALTHLGYRPKEIQPASQRALELLGEEQLTLEMWIKESLRQLMAL